VTNAIGDAFVRDQDEFVGWTEPTMGDHTKTAVLARGCAWIMQQLLRHPDGVISTRTGFMGGENHNPTEENDGGHGRRGRLRS
jgi:hypothetical protein